MDLSTIFETRLNYYLKGVNKTLRQEQQFFNNIADNWDKTRLQDDKKIAMLVSMADIAEGDSVLDVGCGTGVLTPFLKKAVGNSGQITAIDFAAKMIGRAIEKNKHFTGISYITGDINEYESDTPFDKIVCLNFFPHVPDKTLFIQKMEKLLNPGGAIVIMHDISRETVNSKHKDSSIIKNDVLPDVDTVSGLLRTAGYSVANALENDAFYFIKAVTEKQSNSCN